MRQNESIPHLFPARLLDICEARVLSILNKTGIRVHKESQQSVERYEGWYDYTIGSQSSAGSRLSSSLVSRAWPDWLAVPPSSSHYTNSKVFLESAQICREFLSIFLAGPVLDSLAAQAKQDPDTQSPGYMFTFTALCGDRLGRLTVNLHKEQEEDQKDEWAEFVSSPAGSSLILSCLSQLDSLSSLYLQQVATNDMLYVIATVCTRLVLLDISYSQDVTDIGLVHLCGLLKVPAGTVQSGPRGCKYLRELYFNPQSSNTQELIMPRVTACLLRHLPRLQVVDLSNLHSGIDHYFRGSRESSHRQARVKPLSLVHYTGSDKLTEVIDICPKLRTFKLFVTEQLPSLGRTLQDLSHRLDTVTLVYRDSVTLAGFQEFVAACGNKISRLEVDTTQETVMSTGDLVALATYCPHIESIAFTNFRVEVMVDPRVSPAPLPTRPASFPFLTNLKLNHVNIENYGKDVFRYLVGGAHDLESIQISFHSSGYFFSDFLLDDILLMNELAHLREFILRDGALTLISALRLISSRPKLQTIGELLHWDVEPSELDTFIQILRRARSLSLLQDIHIF